MIPSTRITQIMIPSIRITQYMIPLIGITYRDPTNQNFLLCDPTNWDYYHGIPPTEITYVIPSTRITQYMISLTGITYNRICIGNRVGAASITGRVVHYPVNPTHWVIILEGTPTINIAAAGCKFTLEFPGTEKRKTKLSK